MRMDFTELENRHIQAFGTKPQAKFISAGRTELGGNHTDHNLGRVLAAMVDMEVKACANANGTNVANLASEGYGTVSVDLSETEPKEDEKGTTAALLRGIAQAFAKRGGTIGGFDCTMSSSVPQGSGLSSSAAVEILIGCVFNGLFNGNRFSTTDLAIMGQEAENIHFGKPCGLMDQIACANGGIVAIDFKDPKSPAITPMSADFSKYGHDLVIVNTGGSHADLTDDYASVPSDMKNVAAFFGKKVLRDVPVDDFYINMDAVKAVTSERAVMRAMHFFEENARVDEMVQALSKGDFATYLNLVTESGHSSRNLLQNTRSQSHPEEDSLERALDMTEAFLNGNGACRVHGGGFAGTIQTYVPAKATRTYVYMMEKEFGPGCCTVLHIRNTPAGQVD